MSSQAIWYNILSLLLLVGATGGQIYTHGIDERPNSDASNGKPHMVGGHTSIGGNGGPPTMVGGEKEKNKKTCEEGMSMVKNYLETSKIELIQNIKAAKSKQCSLQAWRKVDLSMVSRAHANHVNKSLRQDESGGLSIQGQADDTKCNSTSKVSSLIVHIKGDWQQIMYTQVFKGSCRCWSIFGQFAEKDAVVRPGLEPFNPTMGDIIFGQTKMRSSTDNIFGGQDGGCNGFWSPQNGNGERQATVILRRKKGAKDAGLYTRTFCGRVEYEMKDIYVLM